MEMGLGMGLELEGASRFLLRGLGEGVEEDSEKKSGVELLVEGIWVVLVVEKLVVSGPSEWKLRGNSDRFHNQRSIHLAHPSMMVEEHHPLWLRKLYKIWMRW